MCNGGPLKQVDFQTLPLLTPSSMVLVDLGTRLARPAKRQ